MKTSKVSTLHGPMYVFDDDPWVSRSLRELGEYSEGEFQFIQMILQAIGTKSSSLEVIDAGAYLGDLTIPLARIVDHVHAFEPQNEVREVLEANLELNAISNVTVYPYAIGPIEGVTFYNPVPSLNGPGACMMEDSGAMGVNMVTLDSLSLHPSFIKADMEGMEPCLVLGGQQTLSQERCPLFMEFDTVLLKDGPKLEDFLAGCGYNVYKHLFPMYRSENFNHSPNTFGSTVSKMLLALPPIQ